MKILESSVSIVRTILIVFLIVSFGFTTLIAQNSFDADSARAKAYDLINKDRYLEAIPLLEQIILTDPEDAEASFYYGFTLIVKASGLSDKDAAKATRMRARTALIKAKELGYQDKVLDAFIDSIPLDGSLPGQFSKNEQAEKLMSEGEGEFTKGKYDAALKLYGDALKLDPTIYEAALFSGDMCFRKKDFSNAEIWYQRAISIDPNRETAYRYSASPLMEQKKYDIALDRYVEAFIVEPYSKFASSGLTRWGTETGSRLGHPRFDIPKYDPEKDSKSSSTITLDSSENRSLLAWLGYAATRNKWRESKFSKSYPDEESYRHSVLEEADALRSVAKIAKELKAKSTKLDPQLEILLELDEKGLLEAFVIMAIPDEGIAQDHRDYLRTNRAKLRRYVLEYVILRKNK